MQYQDKFFAVVIWLIKYQDKSFGAQHAWILMREGKGGGTICWKSKIVKYRFSALDNPILVCIFSRHFI